jgi:DNA-binding CsgD family transcriptional regulator
MNNPWDLNLREQEIVSSLVHHGALSAVAEDVGLTVHAIEWNLQNVKRKMNLAHTVLVAVEWTRFVMETPETRRRNRKLRETLARKKQRAQGAHVPNSVFALGGI